MPHLKSYILFVLLEYENTINNLLWDRRKIKQCWKTYDKFLYIKIILLSQHGILDNKMIKIAKVIKYKQKE